MLEKHRVWQENNIHGCACVPGFTIMCAVAHIEERGDPTNLKMRLTDSL